MPVSVNTSETPSSFYFRSNSTNSLAHMYFTLYLGGKGSVTSVSPPWRRASSSD